VYTQGSFDPFERFAPVLERFQNKLGELEWPPKDVLGLNGARADTPLSGTQLERVAAPHVEEVSQFSNRKSRIFRLY
jgi:hypothetical protein